MAEDVLLKLIEIMREVLPDVRRLTVTAKALDITIASALLARADELIE
jgi:hypothetical protein